MDEEKSGKLSNPAEKEPAKAPEEKKTEEIPKELPRIPIAVPVILCPQCYRPMDIVGKVDVEIEEKGLFKKTKRLVPHIEYRCPTDGVEWKESLARRSGGGCFIATATFGTPMAHEVKVLKRFRDNFLLSNRYGEILVRSYYRLSPPIARAIKRSEGLRRFVRILLVPIVNMFNFLYKKH